MGEEGEKERERNMNVSEKHWLLLAGFQPGAWPANPSMCPDQDLNWQTCSSG